MDFQDASYGVSIMGINNYLQELNVAVLVTVSGLIRNCSEIEAAVKANWVGTSADQFILNVNKGANELCDTLRELQETFESEIRGIKDQMMDFDDTLVEAE